MTGKALLAPLAGVSNRPFRLLAAREGAAMTFTEMVSSEGIVRLQKKTLAMMEFGPDEQPLGIQLFGADPSVMNEAAAITVERFGPDLIDINLGCPVKKVVRKNGGAALLKDLDLTRKIIRAVVQGAGDTPVSIKTRTGWENSQPVYLELGRIAEEEGAVMITLHARSRSSRYSENADWSAIRRLKAELSIIVVGNGDIHGPADAGRMMDQTGCDAVMIGRAAMGNPMIFRQINRMLENGSAPEPPSIGEFIELALEHAGLLCQEFGEKRGVMKMRTNLGRYVKGFPAAAKLRPLLHEVETVDAIRKVFGRYLESTKIDTRAPGLTAGDTIETGKNSCQLL